MGDLLALDPPMPGLKDIPWEPPRSVSSAGAPLVTCVVPTFDAESRIAGALACLLAQSHRPIEILVADDGSSDRTVDLVRAAGPPCCRVAADFRPGGHP